MGWTLTDDVGHFQQAVGELLRSEPERNTVLLSVAARLARLGAPPFGGTAPVLGWWPSDSEPRAAALQTPPRPILVTTLPGESAQELASELAGRGTMLSGVNGTRADAAALATEWQALTGADVRTHQRQRLYRLRALVWPDPRPRGTARIAGAADATIAGAWFSAFAAETGQEDAAEEIVRDRLEAGQVTLWEESGEPVSLAGMTDVIAGVARIGPVYTPPGRRGRGYAAGVTAAVSELAMARGASSVILFTDLANPTSNSLYRRLGYEPVEDRVVLMFGG